MFAVQSDVAVRVAEALRARISPEERTRVEKPPTSNVQAYGLYLETLSGHPVQHRDLNLAAVNLLKRAVEMDPTFALARARLAYRTMFLGRGGDRATANEAVRLAREAVRSDPMLAEAHNALATSLSEVGQAQEARASFLRALELAPSHATAMANLSVLEANNGHYDESLRWAWRGFSISGKRANDYYHLLSPYVVLADPAAGRRALELAQRRFPGEPRLQLIFAAYEHQYGDTTAALVRVQRLVTTHPQNQEVAIVLGDLLLLARSSDAERFTEALAKDAPDRVPGGWLMAESMRTRLAFLLQRRGETARAGVLIAQAAAAAATLPMDVAASAIEGAAVNTLKGDTDAAFACLARVTVPLDMVAILDRNPILWRPFRPDPRFQSLLDRARRQLDDQRANALTARLLDLTTLIGPH